MTIQNYLDLITSEHQGKENFLSTVSLSVSLQVRIQDLMESMMFDIFDLDIAIGEQLDIIGQWAGVSRDVSIPVSGVFFSWDDTAADGWDYGVWPDPGNPSTITVLPDDVYRTLIRAKIAANKWDGTTEGAYAVWDSVFPNVTILIQDHQDMSYDLILVGEIIDSLTLSLLSQGYIPLKPEGVRVNTYYTPVNSGPAFGWGVDSEFISGWGTGSWVVGVPAS